MKKKGVLIVMAAIFCVVGAMMFCACTDQVAVTWTVDAHATVTVEGRDSVPEKVDKDSEVKFTVACEKGYEIDAVKVNGKTVKAKDGAYTFTAADTTTVEVTSKRTISGIEVKSKPTNLTYFAGEAVDKTGMVVNVNYATGDSEAITDYNISPANFAGEETSFTVSYEGKTATVELAKPVEYLVTIDPNGGKIADAFLDSYKELNNYSVAPNGVVKFSYLSLAKDVALPTAADMSRDKYNFVFWPDALTSIKAGTKNSVTVKANWEPALVSFAEVKMEIREETVGGETVEVPYLIAKGDFLNTEQAYLYLYEGNDNVSMNGPTIEKDPASAAYEMKFDLRKLSEPEVEEGKDPVNYEGKWMDIRFKATLEDEESQQIYVPTEGMTVDKDQKVESGNYVYSFTTYKNDKTGTNTLKVFYKVREVKNYTVSFADEMYGEGETAKKQPVLTIAGVLGQTFLDKAPGGKFGISFWTGSAETEVYKGNIAADGKFTLKIPMSDLPKGSDCFAHMYLYDAADVLVAGDNNTNFPIVSCSTDLSAENDIGFARALSFDSEDSFTYYVGNKWDGLMVYVNDKRIQFDGIDLKQDGDKAILEISGPTKLSQSDFDAEGVAKDIKFIIQEHGTWAETSFEDLTVTVADGRFTVAFEITSLTETEEQRYFKWVNIDGDTKDFPTTDLVGDTQTVTAGGKTFTLAFENIDTWGKRPCLRVVAAG